MHNVVKIKVPFIVQQGIRLRSLKLPEYMCKLQSEFVTIIKFQQGAKMALTPISLVQAFKLPVSELLLLTHQMEEYPF